MKAAVLYGREDIRVEQIQPAALKKGEARVAVGAALTCGTDLKVFKRGYHARMITPPAVFGHEFAGTIEESAVPEWKPGDRVVVANSAPCGACYACRRQQENLCDDLLFLNGAYAESIVIPARLVEKNMLRLGPSTAFRDAALAEPLACVVHGWTEVAAHSGDNVLVLGSGPIGLMFAVLAREGKCHVTMAGRGPRLQTARQLGVHETIEVPAGESLVETVQGSSAGRHFDVVIEAVGKAEAWEAAIQLVRKGGKVNLFGGCPAGTSFLLDTTRMHYSSIALLSSFHHTPRAIRRALELIEAGIVRAADFVNGEAGLDELPGLFRSMAAGNRTVKTLVNVRRG